MRFASLLQNRLQARSFRLALIYSGLFGISTSLLLASVYLLAGKTVKSHVDEFVDSELELFLADYEVDGAAGVRGLMQSRRRFDRQGHWIYLYQDAESRYLAGDRQSWPDSLPDASGYLSLPSPVHGGIIRARQAHLPDGSRILVGLTDYEVQELRRALTQSIGVGLGLTLVLAVVGGLIVTRTSRRQIESINRVTHEIMAGDLRRRVPASGIDDEFEMLGRNINAMLDRINELMQAVRGATDNVAHDLRLPLARLRGRLEAAQQADDIEQQRQTLSLCIDELDAILRTFSAMLRITNVESGVLRESFTEIDLSAIARDAEQIFEPMISSQDHQLHTRIADDIQVRGNRDLLFQVIANLLDNSLKFTPPGTRIDLELGRKDGEIELLVADNGPGIPAELREQVFQRLFRGDASRSSAGSGLGLSLVRAVVLLHDGVCRIEDQKPGARLLIRLPATQA